MVLRRFAAAAVLLSLSHSATAACMNKFVRRTDGSNRQVVTLLTGKLTFDEAKALAAAIGAKQAPALEWVDDSGKLLATQFGELKVLRPMPVGCDNRASGVVMVATFLRVVAPAKKMSVKLDPNTIVAFEEQAN
jgi:hypothetical protein